MYKIVQNRTKRLKGGINKMFVSAELQTLRKIFIYLRCLSPERLKTQHEITAVIVNNGNLFQQFNNLLNKCKPDTN